MYSKAVVVIVIARLLAELGWALERPASGPATILFSLGLGGATLAFSLLWLVWITMDLRVALGRFAYECAITERPTPDGFVKLYLAGPKLSQTDAIVATLIAPSGGRYFCVHSARTVVINEAGEGTYELEVRLSEPRDVPWNFVGSEPASLELMVAPGFTTTFALGFEIDALRPKRPRY
ncbi:MAG: hypothetical protein JNK05_28525 [Myxococcales bacterium]|nr:hypothetical protein [Myxococcales bacterium]